MKTYTIKNFADLAAALEETENKDDLMQDFRKYLEVVQPFRGIAEVVKEPFEWPVFNWKDDGKHDATIRIHIVPDGEER